jgi:hypothetical protein
LQDMLADSHCIPIHDDVLVTDGFCQLGPVGFAHGIHDTLCFTNNSGARVCARVQAFKAQVQACRCIVCRCGELACSICCVCPNRLCNQPTLSVSPSPSEPPTFVAGTCTRCTYGSSGPCQSSSAIQDAFRCATHPRPRHCLSPLSCRSCNQLEVRTTTRSVHCAVAAPSLRGTMFLARASWMVTVGCPPALLAPSNAHALHAPTALPDLAMVPKAGAQHTTAPAVRRVGALLATSSAALGSLLSHPTGPAPLAQGAV